MRDLVLGLLALALVSTPVAAQTPPLVPDVRAARATRPPVIDGRMADEVWALAEPASSFTQRDPDEGKAPTERTEVRFLYDDEAIYIAAHLYDSDPARITRRMSTRDTNQPDADLLSIYLDPMHDRLTGAIFRVSAANVQQDSILYNDTWTENSWDAVWESAVTLMDDGWCVEIRIPLSQLRFTGGDRQTWGVNVERHIRRKNEYDWLSMVPKRETGIASRMANLNGIDGLRPARRLELLPYTAARGDFFNPKPGNPFNDGARAFASAGLDMKLGVTSNLTATATVNPDFGQVEVDPAVVNLSALETFFQEKRPFFLEGSQIFNNYGRSGSNDFWGFNNSEPQIFYSRRIGRAPQLTVDGDHKDMPQAATILGAAKLTGKTGNGWSLGMLEAVTGEESARFHKDFTSSESIVEPLTNYAVLRVQRDAGGRMGAGLLSTMVQRRLTTEALRDGLTSSAYTFGGDAHVYLDGKKDWVLVGNIAGSRVAGSTKAIEKLQKAAQRYFQRPDAPHVELDATRTSLAGYTSRVMLNRNSGNVKVNATVWTGSPGWESNDLGFHGTGDRVGTHALVFIRDNTPGRGYRSRSAWVSKHYTWNYARQKQSDGLSSNLSWTFMNYINVNGGLNWRWDAMDDRLTRGGPTAFNPGGGGVFWNVNSDARRLFSVNSNTNANWSSNGGYNRNVSVTLNFKPSSRVILSVAPNWNGQRTMAQYVKSVTDTTATHTLGGRYVSGTLDQTQVTMTTRLSVIFSPKVSLQVYAQPLLSGGDYADFRELAAPRTFSFNRYDGSNGSTLAFDATEREYTVDPDGSGQAESFKFDDPDFSVRSLKVNAVFRWELRPGSNFYAVWTRLQQDNADPARFNAGRDARRMFGAGGDDVILFKMAYWIGS